MNNVNHNTWEAGIVDERISNKDKVFVSYEAPQDRFYQELEAAVRKHSQYLQEVAEMPMKFISTEIYILI